MVGSATIRKKSLKHDNKNQIIKLFSKFKTVNFRFNVKVDGFEGRARKEQIDLKKQASDKEKDLETPI